MKGQIIPQRRHHQRLPYSGILGVTQPHGVDNMRTSPPEVSDILQLQDIYIYIEDYLDPHRRPPLPLLLHDNYPPSHKRPWNRSLACITLILREREEKTKRQPQVSNENAASTLFPCSTTYHECVYVQLGDRGESFKPPMLSRRPRVRFRHICSFHGMRGGRAEGSEFRFTTQVGDERVTG